VESILSKSSIGLLKKPTVRHYFLRHGGLKVPKEVTIPAVFILDV
jgi:hypothetical protein